ncbi:hypothetical protein QBC32DRAFT_68413 [Pseudoneurospora amorphoporcata]|uniref:Uncharacterized protein n=1 Tax=Pseudoneurospora amorphoporcata TaxID=241081 RepID=A0AAN6P1Q6_9PEZI|nr:hypothetical protein QBC32DRAFT_68413 [Pseudoneurospora amorphoporcata]
MFFLVGDFVRSVASLQFDEALPGCCANQSILPTLTRQHTWLTSLFTGLTLAVHREILQAFIGTVPVVVVVVVVGLFAYVWMDEYSCFCLSRPSFIIHTYTFKHHTICFASQSRQSSSQSLPLSPCPFIPFPSIGWMSLNDAIHRSLAQSWLHTRKEVGKTQKVTRLTKSFPVFHLTRYLSYSFTAPRYPEQAQNNMKAN